MRSGWPCRRRAHSAPRRGAVRHRGDAARRDGDVGKAGRAAAARGSDVSAALDLQEPGTPHGRAIEDRLEDQLQHGRAFVERPRIQPPVVAQKRRGFGQEPRPQRPVRAHQCDGGELPAAQPAGDLEGRVERGVRDPVLRTRSVSRSFAFSLLLEEIAEGRDHIAARASVEGFLHRGSKSISTRQSSAVTLRSRMRAIGASSEPVSISRCPRPGPSSSPAPRAASTVGRAGPSIRFGPIDAGTRAG